ncbi:hypothetical protein KY332_01995 [Candidatus Woesearchaeota archaeon]|nr:hypothetical protein [Candidatus Woesearchaeota archaeon]
MADKEWYKKEKPKPQKEITIKLNMGFLKQAAYILLILGLVTVIVLQHYGVIPIREEANNSAVGAATKVLEEKETPSTTVTQENETEEENTTEPEPEPEPEEELLPITGDVFITIDKVNYVIKGEDYARVSSVEFTIKNQYKDFAPKIIGYLTQYGADDEKTLEMEELEAGKYITTTSTKLTFGYNSIDEDQILNLEVYDGSKYLVKTTKTFSTN